MKERSGLKRLDLASLALEFQHIPPECGANLALAASVALRHHKHKPGVRLQIRGDNESTFASVWNKGDASAERFFNDLDVAVENGAYAVAIVLCREVTGLSVLERSIKGTGFDWWLGHEDDLFQSKARLEVSGILKGSRTTVNGRVAVKKKQTKRSDRTSLPAYIVVVEFSCPQAHMVKR
ncbi:MAG: hypothetical protein K2X38_24540 [Gemmataceae bacterium]|nr:hypothetical protein [Gemmataceae bacterium]